MNLLGITFHEHPCNYWDLHIDSLLSRAARRLYILRVSKYYVYTKDQLSKLFDSLINVIISVQIRSIRLTPFFREPITMAIQLITSHDFNLISDVIKNKERDHK